MLRQHLFNVIYHYVNSTRPHAGRGILMRLALKLCPDGLAEHVNSPGDPGGAAPEGGEPLPASAGHEGAPADKPESGRRLSYNKVCNLEDFSHPDLLPTLRQVFRHDVGRFGPAFPRGYEYRKHWEVAMAVRTLADAGVLRPDAEVLGVGAGNEPTIFWLTNFVKRVFATDLYLNPGAWGESANITMLTDPQANWPGPSNRRRLVAQHMNALDLAYEDHTFDAIFSSSSIEHFGTPADVRRSIEEMFRVLRPGGILSLATEFRLSGPPPGLPGILMFDADELHDLFLRGLAWAPLSPFEFATSAGTRASETPFRAYADDLAWHATKCGSLLFHTLRFRRYPQLVLREGDLAWTSVHLALRKDSPEESGGRPG